MWPNWPFEKLLVFDINTWNHKPSLSCHAISTDFPDPLSPPPIVHCFRQVFRATSLIGTELMYVGSSWSSCLCSSMWRGSPEYIAYELQLSPTCLVRLILIFFVMGGWWRYSCCFVGCCLQDLFNNACSTVRKISLLLMKKCVSKNIAMECWKYE